MRAREIINEDDSVSSNPTDTVKMDVPLLIRLLEYSREDAADDMALHSVTENLIRMSANGQTLTMNDYDQIVGGGETTDQPQY